MAYEQRAMAWSKIRIGCAGWSHKEFCKTTIWLDSRTPVDAEKENLKIKWMVKINMEN